MIPIRRERDTREIWPAYTIRTLATGERKRYNWVACTDPRWRKRVLFKTVKLAKMFISEQKRSLHEDEQRLTGLAKIIWIRFGRVCYSYRIGEHRMLDCCECLLAMCKQFGFEPEHALTLLRPVLAAQREAPELAVPVIVAELLESLKRQRKSDYYLGPLKLRLGRFAEKFPGPLAQVTDADVLAWLDSLKLEPVTFNHYRAAVSRLISFAVERKHLPSSRTFHVEKVEPPEHEPSIFTPAQLRLVLEHVSRSALPAVLLSAFAGLRPIETLRIRWEAIDWHEDLLIAPRAKKKDARQVPLLPNLRAWLLSLEPGTRNPELGTRQGRMVNMGFSGLTQACARAVRKANAQLAAMGVKDPLRWDADILRHSFGSYRWGLLGAGKRLQVIEEMGNSVRTFMKHYRRLIPRAQAKAWFEIHPDGMRGNLIQLDFLNAISPAKPVLSPPQHRRNNA